MGARLAPGAGATFEQGELQQLLWGYPGLSWVTATLQFILDMNTRIMAYLDAVLRFYIEGKDKEFMNTLNKAFVGIADRKIKELRSA